MSNRLTPRRRVAAVAIATAVLGSLAPAAAAAPVASTRPAAAPGTPLSTGAASQPVDMPAPPQAETVYTAPSTAGATEDPAPAVPLPAPGTERFTPFSKATGNADGTVTTQLFNAPAFTKDKSGKWRRTDAEVGATGDEEQPLRAANTYKPITFGSDPKQLVQLELDGGPVTFSTSQFAKVKPVKDGKAVKYKAVAKDTELEYEVTPAGFQERIVLLSDKAPRSVRFHISDPKGQLGTPIRTAAGGYRFDRDLGEGVAVVIDAPVAFERPASADEPPIVESGSATMSLTKVGDGFDVVKTVDERWLAGKNYPIVLDPAVRFDGSTTQVTDCWLRGGANTNTRWCFNSLVAGNLAGDPSRTVVAFGVANSIPLGARVDAATFGIYQTGNTFGGAQTVTVSRQTSTIPFTNDATWNTYNGAQSWTSVGSVAGGGPVTGSDLATFTNFVTTSATAGYRNVSDTRLTAQVQRWVNQTQPDHGLHLRTLESTSNGYIKWGSSKQNSTQWPFLQVTYTPPTAPELTTFLATDRGCGTALPATLPVVAGAVVTVCVRVKNTNAYGGPVRARVSGPVPAGLTRIALPPSDLTSPELITVDGRYCPDGFDEDYRCSSRDEQSFASVRLALNASYVLAYSAQIVGDDTGCRPITVTYTGHTTDDGTAPTSSSALPLKACEGGLGSEAWWTFDSRRAGPHADLGVNVGNGNAVLQALDATPIQGHGQLSLFLRRTYNSRDTALSALPGTIGAGWTLATGDAGDLSGAGVTPTGLTVPTLADAQAALTSPLSVVLTDRDGTKHRFARRGEGLDTSKLLPAPQDAIDTLRGTLTPRALSAPANHNTVLCVDTSYDPPAGVHLALWRYLAVAGSSCTSGSLSNYTLVGYATQRPDRLRSEFDLLGRLRHLTDASGNQLIYTYKSTGTRGVGALQKIAETGPGGTEHRALSFDYPDGTTNTVVRDSAGRTVVYSFAGGDPTSVARSTPVPANAVPVASQVRLDAVTTYRGSQPSGEILARERYAYWGVQSNNGLACPQPVQPQPAGTLCAASDPRGSTDATSQPVTVQYDSTDAATTRVAQHTDRRGTLTRFTYGTGTTTADRNPSGDRGYDTAGTVGAGTTDTVRRTLYSGIDALGRVARIDRGAPGGSASQIIATSTTQQQWDTTGSSCRLPAGVDNNLCSRTEGTTTGGTTVPYTTDLLYGQEGQLLRETRYAGAGRTQPLVTTHSWRTQYVERSGDLAPCRDYTAPGGGTSTLATSGECTGSPGSATLFATADLTSTLSPRGNGSGESGTAGAPAEQYRLAYAVDNNRAKATNRPPTATSFGNAATTCGRTGTATAPTTPASNTGLRCAERHPKRGAQEALTRYGYDSRGQRTTMITPLALARTGVTNPADATDAAGAARYSYTYWGDGALDLSGTARADGWLKAVTDPTGQFVAFAQDAAGNNARTWDRNATSGTAVTFSTATGGHTEVLHGPAGYASPWRYPTSRTTPEGNRTDIAYDPNGNPTTVTDPRRNTTTSTYSGDDQPTSVLLPEQAAANKPTRHDYDRYGNLVRSTDPNGHVTAASYTTSDQVQVSAAVRGTAPTASGAGGDQADCYSTSSPAADLPGGLPSALPTGHLACATVTSWDDGRQSTGTRDAHRVTVRTHRDGAGRVVDTVVPRDSNQFAHTVAVHNADGQPLRICRPRTYGLTDAAPRTAAGCTAGQVHADHQQYNPAGLLETQTRYRDSTAVPLVTTHTYDADGNPVATADPNSNALVASGGAGYTTARDYDLLQRVVRTTAPRSAVGPGGTPASVTTEHGYDPVGNPILTRAPDGQIEVKAYDLDHRLTDTVIGYTGPTATPTQIRDGARNAVSSADGGSNTHTRLVYDANGNVVVRYGPRAFATSGSPDERFAQRLTYDRDNRPTAAAAGRYDTADSDLDDRSGTASPQQRDQCPTGQPGWPATTGVCTTRVAYDAAGNRTRLTLPTSNGTDRRRVDYTYSHDNLLVAVLSPDPRPAATGQVTSSLGYDGTGRPVLAVTPPTTSSPDGRRTTTAYNADGTAASTTEPGAAAGQTRTTHIAYDADGNPTTVTDPLGQNATTTTTSDGLVSRRVDTGGNTTGYGFDRNGNTTTVTPPSATANDSTNPNGVPTSYAFTRDNLLERVEKPAHADGSTYLTVYGYDDSGRTISSRTVRTRPDGTVADDPGAQTFDYYVNNRPRTHTGRRPNGQAGETVSTCYTADGQPTVIADLPPGSTRPDLCSAAATSGTDSVLTRGYYLDGLLRTAADGVQTLAYGYDGLGSITARTETPNGGNASATRYTYNDAELPVAQTSDRLTGLAEPGWTRSHDANGRPLEERQPNGQKLDWKHHDDDTLAEQRLFTRDGALTAHRYSYDALLRQTAQTLVREPSPTSGQTGSTSTDTYAYDASGRLIRFVDGDNGSTVHGRWDADGNRTCWGSSCAAGSTPVAAEQAAFNPDDSLRRELGSTVEIGYDGAGRRSRDAGTCYTHDGFDRLTSQLPTSGTGCATAGSTVDSATYAYDGLDRQRRRTLAGPNSTAAAAGMPNPARIGYDANTTRPLLQATDASATVGAVRTVLGHDGSAVANIPAPGTPHVLTTDGHGNTATDVDATTSSTGLTSGLACFTRYTPFGQPRNTAPTTNGQPASPCAAGQGTGTTSNDLLYSNERRDPGTGDYQLGARTYQPDQATFLTPDRDRHSTPDSQPGIGFDPLTANTYTYVNGDPVNYTDPTGHKPECGSTPTCQEWASDHDNAGRRHSNTNLAARDQHQAEVQASYEASQAQLNQAFNEQADCLRRASGLAQGKADFHFECGQFSVDTAPAAIPGAGQAAPWSMPAPPGSPVLPYPSVDGSAFLAETCVSHPICAIVAEGVVAISFGGLSVTPARIAAARASTGAGASAVNSAGRAYPKVIDPRTGAPIPYPGSGLSTIPKSEKVPWGGPERHAYIKEWYDRGYSTPAGGWSKVDVHHIRPREYGGTNDFDNLVPIPRTVHQNEFNSWWRNY